MRGVKLIFYAKFIYIYDIYRLLVSAAEFFIGFGPNGFAEGFATLHFALWTIPKLPEYITYGPDSALCISFKAVNMEPFFEIINLFK